VDRRGQISLAGFRYRLPIVLAGEPVEAVVADHLVRVFHRDVLIAGGCQDFCVNGVDLVVGAGSSAVDDVPVLTAVKPWSVGCDRVGWLTAAARRRDWPGWRNPRGLRPRRRRVTG
jgi:hypothetical protein